LRTSLVGVGVVVVVVVGVVVVVAACFHFRVFPIPTHTNVTDFTLRITPALEHLVPAMSGVAACVAELTATRANRVAVARWQKRRLDSVFTLLLTVGGHQSDKDFTII